MKKLFPFLLVACLVMTSCVKEGDFEALKHDISIEGEVSPTFGLPIGYGSATIHDLLSMVQESESYVEVDEDGVITLAYSFDTLLVVEIENTGKGRHPSAKSDSTSAEISHLTQRTFEGSYAVDLFENITILDTLNFEVDSILLNFWAFVNVRAKEGAVENIEKYHVHVYYDSLYINIIGENGRLYPIYYNTDSIIYIDSILHSGQNIHLFDNTDLSNVINKRMREVKYGGRMNIAFEAQFFEAQVSEEQFVTDSIGIEAINIDGHLNVRFPLSTYIKQISYETDIQVASTFKAEDIVVDSSHLLFQFTNGIPLNLDMTAILLDSTDNVLDTILYDAKINGAEVERNDHGRYVSKTPSVNNIDIEINNHVWNSLQSTRKIRLKAGLGTSTVGNNKTRVSIRDTDMLEFKLRALAHASYNLNFDINTSSNKKGGAK